MNKTTTILLSALCYLAVCFARCQGNGCEEYEASAKASGLLGSTLQGSCIPQQYPKQGALLPVTLTTRLLDLAWIRGKEGASDSKTVFGLTADEMGYLGGPLWRSDYYGKADSWKDITSQLKAALPSSASPFETGGVLTVHANEQHPEHVLLQGVGNYHWYSKDNGITFTALPTPGNTSGYGHEIRLHPTQAEWILAKVKRVACETDWTSLECAEDLFVSKDFGTSWKNLTLASMGKIASFHDFDWGVGVQLYEGKPTPDEAIFATAYLSSTAHKGLYPGWDKDLHYITSLDFFASPLAKVIPCGNIFERVVNKIFLAVPSDCPVGPDGRSRPAGSHSVTGRSVTMYVANGDGAQFEEVCLPIDLEDDGYNILYTHDESGAFIVADHAEPGSLGPFSDSPTSDIYAPAYNVSLHTLSLPHVFRRDFVADFSRIEGVPGAFISNQVDAEGLKPTAKGEPTSYLQTRVTFNGGSNWTHLAPPTNFRYGRCNACAPGTPKEQCRLHLHGPTSWLSPEGPHPNLYSVPEAPGVLIGTGNVGAHLDFNPDADCTFMSTDGGVSWQDVAENTGIYEIGDSGGLILMATHRSEGPVDNVAFSLDGGGCWHTVKLPESILVDNVRIDPFNQGHIFIVHGSACYKSEIHPQCSHTGGSQPPSKMFSVDVQELMSGDVKECSKDADYEDWVMGPNNEGNCLLGATRTLKRKKVDAACLNGIAYNQPEATVKPCKCSYDDLECEFGYTKGENNTCVAIAAVDAGTCPRLANSGYLTSNTHRRLVHGNLCKGINDLIPDTNGRGGLPGSNHEGGGSHGGGSGVKSFFSFILIAGIIIVVAGVVWSQCLTEDKRADFIDRIGPLLGMLAGVVEMAIGALVTGIDWAKAKLGALGVPGFAGQGRNAYYEPLAGSSELDLDVEDHRSPPLYHQQP